ncbi:unnamed protein product [Moneuplotes crassus]|uniref:Tyrosine specific protein phosphatases domain-containing protein n=1 Tax=Euplotes crassus TaxID=5936 RepID=A0AAD1XV12_EUPCR|nr:unnamed protein product [Moneuplotes crassus]
MIDTEKQKVGEGALDEPEWMENWRSISAYQKPIEGTNIIPCKVPLDSKYASFCEKNDNFYNLDGLISMLENEGKAIKMILDINTSTYYYNSKLFLKENKKILFEDNLKDVSEMSESNYSWENSEFEDLTSALTEDITYVKAPLVTKELSEESFEGLMPIFEELDKYFLCSEGQSSEHGNKNFPFYIIIHCFHGLNRTGFLISSYLMYKLGLEPKEAIQIFERSRSRRLEHSFMYDTLETFD